MSNPAANHRINRLATGKDRAALARHRGETGKAHGSWEALAKARRAAELEARKDWDNFDHWLNTVTYRVHSIRNEYIPIERRADLTEFARLNGYPEIPF